MTLSKAFYKVLNYTPTKICIETRSRGYSLGPCTDDVPTFEMLTPEDIDYINGRSPIFRTGMLRFDEDVQDEVYAFLKLPNWRETVLFEDEIDNLVKDPTDENLDRIIAIKDMLTIDRVRGRMVHLLNMGEADISSRVRDIVNARFSEICAGRTKSALGAKVEKARTKEEANSAEIEALKAQLAELAKAVEEKPKAPTAPEKPKATTTPRKPKTAPKAKDAKPEAGKAE